MFMVCQNLCQATARGRLDANYDNPCQCYNLCMRIKAPHNYMITGLSSCMKWPSSSWMYSLVVLSSMFHKNTILILPLKAEAKSIINCLEKFIPIPQVIIEKLYYLMMDLTVRMTML